MLAGALGRRGLGVDGDSVMEAVIYAGAVLVVAGAVLVGAWLLGLFPGPRESTEE